MGRAKPVELKRLEGNRSKAKLPPPLPDIGPRPGQQPAPPRDFDAVGKRIWQALWAYAAPWLSVESNYEIVARLCRSYAEYYDLLKAIKAEGRTATGSTGQTVVSPLWLMKEKTEARITRYESLCGLTPSDMQKFYGGGWRPPVDLPEDTADPLDELRPRRGLLKGS